MNLRISSSILPLILPFSLALSGCTHRAPEDDIEKEKLHMIKVVGLAGQYTTATKKPPTSIDAVKEWAIKEGKATEQDFIALRDKQPYGIAAGLGGATVFETVGKKGRCYLWQAGAFREVPQAQVEEMAKANAKAMTGGARGAPTMSKK